MISNEYMHFSDVLFCKNELIALENGGGGLFRVGNDGVEAIFTPADRKVEFICFVDKTLCYVKSAMGYPAIYPMSRAEMRGPIKAVLMDLDGTSVHSEHFWIRVIEMTTSKLLDNPSFNLEDADIPHVSGHSVSEHLQYCIGKYCPEKTIENARNYYFEITREQMALIADGKGWKDAFIPAPGLAEFLMALKSSNIRIGLVTSGLYEKAWPEIVSAFRTLGMGDPRDFYDAIITAGYTLGQGCSGTLGELEAKPHPWLYAETCRVGLGIDVSDRDHVVGIEDSGAGVVSIRLAGYAALGVAGGNIVQSGTGCLCSHYLEGLHEAKHLINSI